MGCTLILKEILQIEIMKHYKTTLLELYVKNKNQLKDIFKNNKAHKRGKGKLKKN